MREEIRYFLQEPGAPFEIEISGKSWCDGTYRIFRENPNMWVIEYIISGQGSIETKGKVYRPEAGDVYLLPPGIRHCYYSDEKDPWEKIFINFRGSVVKGLAEAYRITDVVLFPQVGKEVEALFFKLYQWMEDKDMADAQVISETEMLIHKVFRLLGKKLERHVGSDEIRTVREYLETHVADRVTINELASLIYRSPDYLIRHFRSEVGMTPYRYFVEKKMEVAERMLRNTTLSVSEIGEQLGYDDPHYFSNVFKKEKSISPLRYRKQQMCICEK